MNAKSALYGKFVKSDANGNFVVASQADFANGLVVGQVYGVEVDIPPAGFLQYFMEMSDNEYLQFIKDTQIIPSMGRTKDDAAKDPMTSNLFPYPLGVGYLKDRKALAAILNDYKAGIPFLTDGYFKARTTKTYAGLDDASVIDIRVAGNVSVADLDKSITVSDYVGSALFIRIKEPFAKDMLNPDDVNANAANLPEFAGGPGPANIKVFLQSADYDATDPENIVGTKTQVSAANLHIDYQNNMVVVYFTSAVEEGTKVIIEATVLENQIPGIPTGWDFKGNIGEARILLMK
jgi:hypothetical protein